MSDSTLVWDRPEPPERPAPSLLSRARIVAAAVALADAEGLEAVSIRKVAAALDAGPMRLYRYVDTKEELLLLMVDAVYAEMPAPAGRTWREAVRSAARGVREAALAHEWFADLLGGRPHLGPATLAHADALLAAIRSDPGVPDIDTAMRITEALALVLNGAVRKEVAERRAERASGKSEAQWQAASGPYLERMLATGRYETLAEAVRDARHLDAAEIFELGLDYLLDGIEANLPSRDRRR
ncbi:TetR/AcrR family transcriptional regulator C-terminal domain-containing protein [Hyalangium minutum]|uniref:Transcriptional regulator, TetR family protein n=1 Tax=Hyalangium minutum TaxID=394096 RepID=A0A085WRX8_9BACT|nr:TetR/AcrR family transcriptional regulator C-terminal domain-containing protein [Hyalangium minutum]KFE70441.1 Transcriptional regulator, TetR family protein [Hyalangium minutum]